MKKNTKKILVKVAVGLTAIVGSAFLLFGKKGNKKDTVKIDKDNDKELFI